MEDAFEAVGKGVRRVVADPILVGATAVVLVLLVPLTAVVGLISLLTLFFAIGPVVFRAASAVLLKPLLFGGLVGTSAASFEGEASLWDVVRALEDGRGVSLAVAYGVQEVVLIVAGVGLAAVYFAGQFAGEAAGVPYTALQFWGGTVWLVGAVAYAVVAATLQFVDAAAILDGAGAREALRRSYRLTRSRPGEVAGYTVLRVLLVGVCVLPGVVILTAGSWTEAAPQVLEPVGWAATLLLLPFGIAAAVATHVAYYRVRTDRAR